jgi:hypothetical protein
VELLVNLGLPAAQLAKGLESFVFFAFAAWIQPFDAAPKILYEQKECCN